MHRPLPALAAVLVLVLSLAPGCGSGDRPAAGPRGPSHSPEPSGTAFPPAVPADVLGRVEVGGGACGVLVAAGRVWVSSYADGTLSAVDPRTMTVVSTTRVGDKPCGLAYGAGSVWVENYGSFDVTRVDARSGRRVGTYDVKYSPYDVTFTDGAAWVTNNGSASVSRIDAGSGKVTTIRTGGHPVGITVAAGRVWVALGDRGLAVIDPATSQVERRRSTDEPTGWTAADGVTVWIDVGDGVQEIDARSGAVRSSAPLPRQPADGSAVGGTAYVPQRRTGLVSVVRGGAVRQVLDTGLRDPFVLAAAGKDLWIADFGGDTLVRVRRPA